MPSTNPKSVPDPISDTNANIEPVTHRVVTGSVLEPDTETDTGGKDIQLPQPNSNPNSTNPNPNDSTNDIHNIPNNPNKPIYNNINIDLPASFQPKLLRTYCRRTVSVAPVPVPVPVDDNNGNNGTNIASDNGTSSNGSGNASGNGNVSGYCVVPSDAHGDVEMASTNASTAMAMTSQPEILLGNEGCNDDKDENIPNTHYEKFPIKNDTDRTHMEQYSTGTNNINLFQPEFYLTSLRSQDDYEAANINPLEQPHVHFGRPNISLIFQTMKKLCIDEGIKRVGVIVCGPVEMVKDVTNCCKVYSGNIIDQDMSSVNTNDTNTNNNATSNTNGTNTNVNGATVAFDLHTEEFDF